MKVKLEEKFDIAEFETKLKSILQDDSLENRKFIHSFLEEKRKETNFNELEGYYKKVKFGIIVGIIIVALVITFSVINMLKNGESISGNNTKQGTSIITNKEVQPILKATYHIAYFEDIEIIDKLSKDLNLSENEYAKFIYYSPDDVGKEILIKKDSISLQPKFIKVEFKKLGYIFGLSINSFLRDTNQSKRLIISGNMPKTPSDVKRRGDSLHLINKDQFELLKKNNHEVLIFLKSKPTIETQKLMNKFDKNNIKYEIIK